VLVKQPGVALLVDGVIQALVWNRRSGHTYFVATVENRGTTSLAEKLCLGMLAMRHRYDIGDPDGKYLYWCAGVQRLRRPVRPAASPVPGDP
jgi:hypothetical protein